MTWRPDRPARPPTADDVQACQASVKAGMDRLAPLLMEAIERGDGAALLAASGKVTELLNRLDGDNEARN